MDDSRPQRSAAGAHSHHDAGPHHDAGSHHGVGSPADARRVQARASAASGFVSGPAELLDFVLPVLAGQFLGATGAQTGALVATQLVVSLLTRPLAGVLVDRGRSVSAAAGIAAAGSAISLIAFLVFAVSATLLPAFAAAAICGVGGAFFWVAIRALIARRAGSGDDRFAALMENESSGSWIAFVIGIPLFQAAGPQVMFLGCAASCLVAVIALGRIAVSGRRRDDAARSDDTARRDDARRRDDTADPTDPTLFRSLRGILALTAVVAFAEGIVSLLLILHLLHDEGLSLGEIGFVYLPGAIVLSIAPRPLHRLVRRVPPRTILLLGLGNSAAFAAAMTTRPGPVALAVLWVLSALCFSLLIPLLERLVAEVSGPRAGRGFGCYQSADLLGAAVGSLIGGILFGAGAWPVATIGAALVLVLAALGGRHGLRRFTPSDPTPRRKGLNPAMKKTARNLTIHIGIYLIAQVIFAVIAQSWPWEVITGGASVTTLLSWNAEGGQMPRLLGSVSRIWTIVVIIDLIWSGYRMLVPKDTSERTADRGWSDDSD